MDVVDDDEEVKRKAKVKPVETAVQVMREKGNEEGFVRRGGGRGRRV